MKYGNKFLAVILTWLATWLVMAGTALAQENGIPYAKDFAADARIAQEKQIPILVLFSAPECHYCERARQEFLIPITRNPVSNAKVLMRQVEIGASGKLRDFNGKMTTQGDFATLNKVRLTPTIKVYGPDGRELAAPIVGLAIADYYGGYIDDAINQGLDKIRTYSKQAREP